MDIDAEQLFQDVNSGFESDEEGPPRSPGPSPQANRSPDRQDSDHEDVETAQLELENANNAETGEKEKKKRVIRNPQPKLDPDRITGRNRGIGHIEKMFTDFKPKGRHHEFSDLALVMNRLEHWAHRLYPKLPFDDVANRMEQLGKKQAVKTYIKKLRMGDIDVDELQQRVQEADDGQRIINENESGDEADATKRYDDAVGPEEDEDVFESLMRQAEEEQEKIRQAEEEQKRTQLSEEQRNRMLRNKQMAEERKKAKKQQSQSQNVEETNVDSQMTSENSQNVGNSENINVEVEETNVDSQMVSESSQKEENGENVIVESGAEVEPSLTQETEKTVNESDCLPNSEENEVIQEQPMEM